MKQNQGTPDRIMRFLAAVWAYYLIFTNAFTSLLPLVLGILAGVIILTSMGGTCHLYMPFGIGGQVGMKYDI